jgi:hypothetical protein
MIFVGSKQHSELSKQKSFHVEKLESAVLLKNLIIL